MKIEYDLTLIDGQQVRTFCMRKMKHYDEQRLINYLVTTDEFTCNPDEPISPFYVAFDWTSVPLDGDDDTVVRIRAVAGDIDYEATEVSVTIDPMSEFGGVRVFYVREV